MKAVKLVGDCQSAVGNNGIQKTTITIRSNGQPQYLLSNLLKETIEFQEGDIVDITIKIRRRPNPTGRNG